MLLVLCKDAISCCQRLLPAEQGLEQTRVFAGGKNQVLLVLHNSLTTPSLPSV